MKKFLLLIILMIICGLVSTHDYSDISRSIYVNSIGFDYDKETKEYIVYFHMTNPVMYSTTELAGSDAEKSYIQTEVKGKNIIEAIQTVDNNSNQEIRLTHITSIVLSTNFATYENIELINKYVKTHEQLYPTPNMFVTDSDIKEIFEIINVDGISPNFSIITDVSPDTTYKMTRFQTFSSDISENKGTISFPFIKLRKDIWSKNSEVINSIELNGKQFITKEKSLTVFEKDFPGILFYEDFEDNTCIFEDFSVLFQRYKVKTRVIDEKNVEINVSSTGRIQNSFLEEDKKINDMIHDYIVKFIDFSIENDLDIYQVKDLMYRYNKSSGFELKTTTFHVNVSIRIYR